MKIISKVFVVFFLFFAFISLNAQDTLEKKGYMVYTPKPAPFGPNYSFQLAIPDTSNVKVYVVDDKANSIRNIFEGVVVNNLTRFSWDMKNEEDSFVQSGIYFFVVEATLNTISSTDMYYKSSFPILLIK